LTEASLAHTRPDLKARELKQVLIESSTILPSLQVKVASGDIVNTYHALQLALKRPLRKSQRKGKSSQTICCRRKTISEIDATDLSQIGLDE